MSVEAFCPDCKRYQPVKLLNYYPYNLCLICHPYAQETKAESSFLDRLSGFFGKESVKIIRPSKTGKSNVKV